MGYLIENDRGDCFRATTYVWPRLLYVAKANGWHPMGTKHDNPNWGGGYESNDAQSILADDATSLAAALQRAIETDTGIADALALEQGRHEQLLKNIFPGGEVIEPFWYGYSFRDEVAEAAGFFTGEEAMIF